jgi:ABC-type multidrug transport system fused ATPase/permease subunit
MRSPQDFYRRWVFSEFKIIGRLLPLIKRHPLAVTVIIVMGCLIALSEGIGISLFIPLLYSLNVDEFKPETDDWLGRLLNRFFEVLPPTNRLIYISFLIFGFVFLRGLLLYGSNILSAWLNARLSHFLRCSAYDQLLNVGMRFID